MTRPLRVWRGDSVRAAVTFTDNDTGEVVDATGVVVRYQTPAGAFGVADAVEDADNRRWICDLPTDQPGTYRLRATCAAPAAAAVEDSFTVVPSLAAWPA